MNLLTHLNRSALHLKHVVHSLPWPHAAAVSAESAAGSFVLAVVLVSVAAAAVLVLAA